MKEGKCSESSSGTKVQDMSETIGSTKTSTEGCSDTNEQFSPEYLQRKLYFLLEHLKNMHSELPE